MKKMFFLLLTFGLLVSMAFSPVMASAPTGTVADRVPPTLETPSRPEPELVSQEIQDLF